MNRIRTPCIGICSTTSVGDRICRGCKRYAEEVIHWNAYSDEEKTAVLRRIEKLSTQILEHRLLIFSVSSLRGGMNSRKIPYDESLSPYCWLHNLLKRCHRELTTLDEFGVQVRQQYRHLSLPELYQQVDAELMTLCEAHYSRYVESPYRLQVSAVADTG